MAQIIEENIIITVSRIVKKDAEAKSIISEDILAGLEEIAGQMFGDSAVVEVNFISDND